MLEFPKARLSFSDSLNALSRGFLSVFNFYGFFFSSGKKFFSDPMTPEEVMEETRRIMEQSWQIVGENLRQAIEGYGKKHG